MKGRKRVALLRRVRMMEKDGSGTLHFQIMDARRPEFLPREAVPDFDGEEAWFMLERVRGPVWMTWKVLRQVESSDAGWSEVLYGPR
ncbi:hypothetical protein [Phenylobacterium sp.]|uniref:hypothetical protein n=1 Tax=Phenylobacterium sp. TaxID=1871053 RepID=UPI0035AF2D89